MKKVELTSELRSVFEERGIRVVRILFHGTNCLSIYVQTAEEVEAYKKQILKHGKQLLDQITTYISSHFEDAKEYDWAVFCINNLYSEDDRLVNELVREKKNEVVQALTSSSLGKFTPKYVFSHSSNDTVDSPAGYNVIFANSRLLKKSKENGIQNKIDTVARSSLSTDNRYIADRFEVSFSHSKFKGIYGMSRED